MFYSLKDFAPETLEHPAMTYNNFISESHYLEAVERFERNES